MLILQPDLFRAMLFQLPSLPVDVLPVLVGGAAGITMRNCMTVCNRNPSFFFRNKIPLFNGLLHSISGSFPM